MLILLELAHFPPGLPGFHGVVDVVDDEPGGDKESILDQAEQELSQVPVLGLDHDVVPEEVIGLGSSDAHEQTGR